MRVFDCESGANADCTFAVNGTMQDFGDNVVSNVEPQAAATFATPCRVEGLKHAFPVRRGYGLTRVRYRYGQLSSPFTPHNLNLPPSGV